MPQQKVRRPKEEVARLLESWRTSGLSARAFSEQEAIPTSTLYHWARTSRVAEQGPSEGQEFVAIEVPRTPTAVSAGFRVALKSPGREIVVPAGFDAGELARLVKVLES